jgi:hypothetical protein
VSSLRRAGGAQWRTARHLHGRLRPRALTGPAAAARLAWPADPGNVLVRSGRRQKIRMFPSRECRHQEGRAKPPEVLLTPVRSDEPTRAGRAVFGRGLSRLDRARVPRRRWCASPASAASGASVQAGWPTGWPTGCRSAVTRWSAEGLPNLGEGVPREGLEPSPHRWEGRSPPPWGATQTPGAGDAPDAADARIRV